MNGGKTKKGTGKLRRIVGIGGIYCNCCTLGPKPVTKKLWNGVERAQLKVKLIKELREMEEAA